MFYINKNKDKMTTIYLDGYFTEDKAQRIVEVMQGKTYMNFEVSYSRDVCNCTVIVATDRPDTTEHELRDMFYFYALNQL